MIASDFECLNVGDVVRNKLSGVYYVVAGNYGDRVSVVRVVDITDPVEWDLVNKTIAVERRAVS